MKGNDEMSRQARMQRELLLLRYTDAITDGDLDTVGSILDQAANDPDLERGIWETHLALGEELRQEETRTISAQLEKYAAQVTELAASHFSAPLSLTPIEGSPPPLHEITVGELAAALRSSNDISPEIQTRLRFLERSDDPCDTDLSVRGIRSLLARMGVDSASKRLVEKVQNLLFTLGMQRQGPEVRLAAARRQRSQRGLDASPEADSGSDGLINPRREETP